MPERNQIIDDLRGICMLGVIGIHVGSFVLEAPYPNSFLYMLLEILSRYSVCLLYTSPSPRDTR